jgi:hypothetical protein
MNITFLSKTLAILDGEPTFCCPGCGSWHSFAVTRPNVINGRDHRWTWNNDPEHPTFTPSFHLLVEGRTHCHLWLRGGVLDFLGDSAHALAGQKVKLPSFGFPTLLQYGYYNGRDAEYEADRAEYFAHKAQP